MKCDRCGNDTLFDGENFCPRCGAFLNRKRSGETVVKPSGEHCIAWEGPQRGSAPVAALWSTVKAALLHPGYFYGLVAAQARPVMPAWIFGLIAGGISLVASALWSTLLIRYGYPPAGEEALFGIGVTAPSTLIAAPFVISMELLFSTAYIHLMMRLGRLRKVPFAQTFRLLCYAQSALLLSVIPVIGIAVGSVLWLYAVLTGLHHLHNASRMRTFFALLLPMLAFVGILTVLMTAGILGGILAGSGIIRTPFSLPDLF